MMMSNEITFCLLNTSNIYKKNNISLRSQPDYEEVLGRKWQLRETLYFFNRLLYLFG